MKVYFVSLGCPKNLTDTEVLMGQYVSAGYEITDKPAEADVIIVNTCAFLKTARDEAYQTIKELAQWKKKGKCKELYIAGCLPKWIKLSPSPSGRGVWGEGIDDYIDGYIDSIHLYDHCAPRIKATEPWFAYVKIAEGCNNRCSYCLIPTIRGRLRVRKMADILAEVKQLIKHGVKEVVFIAQDTTAYPDFDRLLRKTARLPGLHWLRIMYTHPAHLTAKVLKVMATEPKIVKYLDLPIQHGCDKILKSMGRRYTRQQLVNLISKIRREVPNIALRTTVLTGFPGEGQAEFAELLDLVKLVRFERLGVFVYQREKGTPAAKLRPQVPQKTKIERAKKLMRTQARISRERNQQLIGQRLEVLIEKVVATGASGRSYLDAPDIDGTVSVRSKRLLKPGEFVAARIIGARTYDLVGCLT